MYKLLAISYTGSQLVACGISVWKMDEFQII